MPILEPSSPSELTFIIDCPKVKELEKLLQEKDVTISERDVTISDLRNENEELKRQIEEGN